MDSSITEVARLTGTTSRTLRHYQDIGLLTPSRVGPGGMRYYDEPAIRRLQRILLLRQLGLGLPAIADALQCAIDDEQALTKHIGLLRLQRERLDRQIAAVERTIAALRGGEALMAREMLDGFDHAQYREEVEQRWGRSAYQRSDRWYRGLSAAGRQAFLAEAADLGSQWQQARAAGLAVDSEQVRALAERQISWITEGWGGVRPDPQQIVALAQMYVDDERFAANYGGVEGAAYVRDALLAFVS